MKTTDYTENDLNRKRPRANISLETYTYGRSTERYPDFCVVFWSCRSRCYISKIKNLLRSFKRRKKKREINANENTGGSNSMHYINYKTAYAVTSVLCTKLLSREILIRDHLTLS